jgi:homospermidine synthase
MRYKISTAMLIKIEAPRSTERSAIIYLSTRRKTQRLPALQGLKLRHFVIRNIQRNEQINILVYNHLAWKVNGLIQHILFCYMKSHEHYTH